MRSNADMFAARGDQWCTPNFQHDAVYSTHGMKIEGYGRDGIPTKAKEKVEKPAEPRRERDAAPYVACNRAIRIKMRARAILRSMG